MIVALMVALRDVPVPVEVKFVVVCVLGVAGSFALSWLLRRWRPLSRLL